MSKDASVQVEEHKGFCNHWSSYRLSLRQTWRELKLRPRSSINWMIDIFAGTSTNPKADFTFCLNAGFYFDVFTWALIHAFYYPVMITMREDLFAMFRHLLAWTFEWYHSNVRGPWVEETHIGFAEWVEEGEEGEWYHKDLRRPYGFWEWARRDLDGPWVEVTNIGFAKYVEELASASLLILCFLVLLYGLIVVSNYFHGYMLYSGVLMSKNTCDVFGSKKYLLVILVSNLLQGIGLHHQVLFLVPPASCIQFLMMIEARHAAWARIIVNLTMIKCAFHIRFITDEATSETESLLQPKREL